MNVFFKVICFPLVLIKNYWENHLKKTNPERLFSFRYYRNYGKMLNLETPLTLYDKIAYMAFRTDTFQWSDLADKLKVRSFVEKRGFGYTLTKLYGSYDDANDIDYSKLPSQFVLKTNNASATNIIVKDKSSADIPAINRQLNKWLQMPYGYDTCQPHYSRIVPKIIAEEFLNDKKTTEKGEMLIDYKFYCFDGEPTIVIVMSGRSLNTHKVNKTYFDMDWQCHPEYMSKKFDGIAQEHTEKPVSFEKMKEMAAVLSKGFPFVRVDFYEINGNPVFGEMTFTPGMDTGTTQFHLDMGKLCIINK